jgi:hypothetical protein
MPGAADPDAQPEPDPVATLRVRASEVTRSRETGHPRGGAMGEKDAEKDGVQQYRRRNAEPGELLGAQVTDDRAVGEQEKRFGEERAERRQGEAKDLPVGTGGLPRGIVGEGTSGRAGVAQGSLSGPGGWR